MALVMNAKTTDERLDRLEAVLGIEYKKVGNIASVSCYFGGITKVEAV
jgi:hypothetical protein